MIGAMIVLVGFLLELFADIQMQTFRKARKSKDEIIRIGLWKHARHPNYLGEILVWFLVFMYSYYLANPRFGILVQALSLIH